MKTSKMLALTTALLLGLASICYAGYVRGFKVVAVADEQVTIQKDKAEPVKVLVAGKKFAVGDKVMFDAKKQKMIPETEGC